MNFKDIETILRNESYYRNLVKYHFFEKKSFENLNVQKTFDNSNEKNLIFKLENNDYLDALKFVNAIDILYSRMSPREKLIYSHRFKYKMSVERISYEINYSTSTVWYDLNNIKKKFIECLEKL